MLALEGLRVVDLSQGIPGALCAMQLGDLGAGVVKVEPPTGDWLRTIGPFQRAGADGAAESALFLQFQRNKRGVAVDLKGPAGAELLWRLLESADVLVEGYRPGVMARLGFDYETVSARHPRLVYCSISGNGSRGPLAGAPVTEIDLQATVGSNRHLGRAEDPPLRFGFDYAQARGRARRLPGHHDGAALARAQRPRPARRDLAARGLHGIPPVHPHRRALAGQPRGPGRSPRRPIHQSTASRPPTARR